MKLMQVKVDGKDVSSNIINQSTTKPFKFVVNQNNPYQWEKRIVGGNILRWHKIIIYFSNRCRLDLTL
jgi:hypothetical protein